MKSNMFAKKVMLSKGLSSIFFLVILYFSGLGQTIEDYGYRFIEFETLNSETMKLIVKSKPGEDQVKKPLFIFVRGSGASPLVKFTDQGKYYLPFPFSENIMTEDFHLVCINKPGIPVLVNKNSLTNGEFRVSNSGLPPREFIVNNHLQYYVDQIIEVIGHLSQYDWVDQDMLVIAGHSEGSSVAVKAAKDEDRITHVIYSGGTPYYPRIVSMITQDRNSKDSTDWAEEDIKYWQGVVGNPEDLSRDHGFNTYKGTYSFSESLNEEMKKLTIPVLVSYGTKDTATPFVDLLHVEVIHEGISHIHFLPYRGLEHNYFPLIDGRIDYSNFGWDKVALDWKKWLFSQKRP